MKSPVGARWPRDKNKPVLWPCLWYVDTYDGDGGGGGGGGGGGCDQDTDYGDGDACIYWSASSEDPTRSAIVSCCVACHRRGTHKISTFSLVFNRLTRFNLFFKGWSCWVACHRRELVQSSWWHVNVLQRIFLSVRAQNSWSWASQDGGNFYHLVEVVDVELKEVVILEWRSTEPCVLCIYLKLKYHPVKYV